MVGYGFMGAAHSQGWRVAPRFFDLPAQVSMNVLVGRHADAVDAAAQKWGWAESATDWRTLLFLSAVGMVTTLGIGLTPLASVRASDAPMPTRIVASDAICVLVGRKVPGGGGGGAVSS